MRKTDILLAILVALVFGGTYIAIKYAIIEIPGLLSLAIRYLIVSSILLPFVPRPNKEEFSRICVVSVAILMFSVLIYYGISLGVSTNVTIIIMQLTIPISVIIARFSLNENFTLSSSLGIMLALVGVSIVLGSPRLNINYLPLVTIFLAAFFYALSNIQSRRLSSISPLSLLCWSNLVISPNLFIISYFFEGNPFELLQGITYKSWISVSYLVVGTSLVGMGTLVYLLQKYPVQKVAPFALLEPFFGIILSSVILGKTPSSHTIIGGIVILSGVALSQMSSIPFLKSKET